MGVISVSAQRAYGLYKDPSSNSNPQQSSDKSTNPQADKSEDTQIASTSDSSAVVVQTTSSQSSSSPQNVEAPKVSSLFSGDSEGDAPSLPPREEVDGLSKKYLNAIGNSSPSSDDIKKVSDFYGATPDRFARLSNLVSGLEGGKDTPLQGATTSVAVA